MKLEDRIKRFRNIETHVTTSILSVLQRPRFGIEVTPDGKFHILEKDGFKYRLIVQSSNEKTSIHLAALDQKSPPFPPFFYESVENDKLPNLRKLGTTMANKLKFRAFHYVMSE